MTDWSSHPFLDPRQAHGYEGGPPTAFVNPYEYGPGGDPGLEHEWWGRNDALERQLREDRSGQYDEDDSADDYYPVPLSRLMPTSRPTVEPTPTVWRYYDDETRERLIAELGAPLTDLVELIVGTKVNANLSYEDMVTKALRLKARQVHEHRKPLALLMGMYVEQPEVSLQQQTNKVKKEKLGRL